MIKINKTEICLRPSSIDSFMSCPHQWAKTYLEGCPSMSNARAGIGTAIHRGIEVMWNEAIAAGKKDANISMMVDASVAEFDEISKDGMRFDGAENQDTAHTEIIGGTKAYVEDCLPFLDIPDAVEQRFEVAIGGHPVVSTIGGTVDYIGNGIIDDVKTSKRKIATAGHTTQQSIYKYLAEANGHKIHLNRIQGVVLTKKQYGMILDMETDVEAAKASVNVLLDTIEMATKDLVPIDLLFRCNTKHYLCSPKYCASHGSCPATKRHTPD